MTPDIIDKLIEEFITEKMSECEFSEIYGYSFEGVPIQDEPNPSLDIWILFSIRNNSSNVVEIGKNGIGIRDGNLHINVFTPKENGKRKGANYAGVFENIFRRISVGDIVFGEPHTSFVTNKDWLNHHIVIPFYTTTGE